jgi:hypothetical protein
MLEIAGWTAGERTSEIMGKCDGGPALSGSDRIIEPHMDGDLKFGGPRGST